MGRLTVLGLRAVIAMVLAGSLFIQVVIVPLLADDLGSAGGQPEKVRWWLVALTVLGILTVQVTAVCIWRLLTLVGRGAVFSPASFRYVDVMAGSAAAASAIVFGYGVLLAPGEDVAPGVVLLIGGLAVLVAGVALVILLLRTLLVQAIHRDAEASSLQAELDEVI